MLAIFAGSAAAIAFGVSTSCSARTSRVDRRSLDGMRRPSSAGFRSQPLRDRTRGSCPAPRLGAASPTDRRHGRAGATTSRCGCLRLTRRVAPLVLTAAGCEVAGFALYTLGARHDIAVTAVLVSLFGAVAAVLARLVFEERLARVQTAGIATIVAGISTLSLLGS